MFHSTRNNKKVDSFEAIMTGLAADGGLYVLDDIPSLHYQECFDMNYVNLAAKILSLYFVEFDIVELEKICFEAYQSFYKKNTIDIQNKNSYSVLELYHGPTMSFKDFGLAVLPRLMEKIKEKTNDHQKTTILTATSGDTGGAALNGFSNLKNIEIAVLYPLTNISAFQEYQMLSYQNEHSFVIGVHGNFDDCQKAIKLILSQEKYENISTANSINIGRLIPQIVYYYFSYIQQIKKGVIKKNEEVNYVVPTGNFGNILAGYLAKKMGLPIHKLICASNENKVLTDFFQTGIYNKNRPFLKTNSPSMDIIVSSNLERLLFYLSQGDFNLIKQLMEEFNKQGVIQFSQTKMSAFDAFFVTNEETKDIIKKVYEEEDYIIDPHTAVAVGAYEKYLEKTKDVTKTIIISTASPLKFSSTVLEAIGENVVEDEFQNMTKLAYMMKSSLVFDFQKTQAKQVISIEEISDTLRRIINVEN